MRKPTVFVRDLSQGTRSAVRPALEYRPHRDVKPKKVDQGRGHETRRVLVTASTAHPGSAWVTQQARNLSMDLDGRAPLRFLIHDRDSKFPGSFDEVFRSEGTEVILTPIRASNANAFAERWVRAVRAECLDWMLIFGRRHLDRVLRTYADHYNRLRPHRGLGLSAPLAETDDLTPVQAREVRRRDVLDGLIHEYHGAAA